MIDTPSAALRLWASRVLDCYDDSLLTENATASLLAEAIFQATGKIPRLDDLVAHAGLSKPVVVQARRRATDLSLLDRAGAFLVRPPENFVDQVPKAAIDNRTVPELAWQLQTQVQPNPDVKDPLAESP